LNLPVKGGLSDRLQKKGWITGLSVYAEGVNGLKLVSAYFQLTPEGATRRRDVAAALFAAVHEVRAEGMKPAILDYLRQRNVLSYQYSTRKADQAAEYLARFLDSGLPVDRAFDFPHVYGKIEDAELREAAKRIFSLDRMLGGYVGGDV